MNPQGSIYNKDDAENHPLISRNANDQRPSEGWLRNPVWIDDGVNPPCFYHSHQEVNDALVAAGVTPGIQYDQYAARVTPTPVATEPPVPLTPSLINLTNNHYRTGVDSTAPASKGHLINVTLMYSSTTAAPTGWGKAVPKKCKNTKMDMILLDSITCVDFVKAILGVHGISDKFAPGVHSGPDFKMWWNGAVGSKGGTPSIQNDHQFSVALGALLKKDKSKLPPSISDAPTVGGDKELAYGTRVPCIDNFSKLSQLHGKFIIDLEDVVFSKLGLQLWYICLFHLPFFKSDIGEGCRRCNQA
ncbi:uncharacterized protein LACBIDRAFT_331920 [Laccaria bicolor S238N-H82]|uniref:Predicted protein n=1 Tax=Laccaria bicolor (strain S238N-H82 / ATCC MYA-4686) TaxID=486041 RepID=B0DR18_LACBS|nr:uncharacterized protein LACBIDRAFT_331918 [Laccaria bicolor S238N-H82]XP_001886345.1 uncharacterized protein LACBIDRAFT_331920 [Laccaria bicolor S238N-H82]EDR02921.1 predicted protein [Laccaria bicolor S238N-H82]EDR02922.1 predicted protein [Laccaria bicolor S238N-H82]|eukprot:XP_001886344.1 predicted protein [Laccaria bicolor S238N-H82]